MTQVPPICSGFGPLFIGSGLIYLFIIFFGYFILFYFFPLRGGGEDMAPGVPPWLRPCEVVTQPGLT